MRRSAITTDDVTLVLRRLAVVALMLVGTSACGMAPAGSSVGVSGTVAASGAVVASIPLPDFATDVAVRADGARIYVPLRTGKVVAIDAASRQLATTIPTDGQPYGIALTADGSRAYVPDATAQSIFALDLVHDQVVKRIPAGTIQRPILSPGVAVSRDGAWAYVTEATAEDDHLLVVDTASNTIAGDHFLAIHPVAVAVRRDGRLVIAGCKLSCIDGTLLVLDPTSFAVVSQIALASAPTGLVLAPDGSRAYVSNGRDASVSVIDLAAKTVTTVAVGAQPLGLALDPGGAFLYVASFGSDSVSVLDTRIGNVVATVPVPRGPRAVAVSPDGRLAYVAHSSSCSVLDLARVARSAPHAPAP